MKIIMIEDNPAVCEMMEMFFQKEQWDSVFIQDGKEGLLQHSWRQKGREGRRDQEGLSQAGNEVSP